MMIFCSVCYIDGAKAHISQMKDFPVRVRSRGAGETTTSTALEAGASASATLTMPSTTATSGRRDYFAKRIAEIRDQAVRRAAQAHENKLQKQQQQLQKKDGQKVLRTKSVKQSHQAYFATRIMECRKRTLMASIEAAKAARERAAEMKRKDQRTFMPMRPEQHMVATAAAASATAETTSKATPAMASASTNPKMEQIQTKNVPPAGPLVEETFQKPMPVRMDRQGRFVYE